MTDKEVELLRHKIDAEGFDYCFRLYSDWEEIKDPKFHELREAYKAAADALDDHIPSVEDEDEDEEDDDDTDDDDDAIGAAIDSQVEA